MAERGQHDLGGQDGGTIDPAAPPTKPWAKLITATVGALREHKLMTVDEMRRCLEDLPTDQYDLGYFERWAEALTDLVEEKDILTHAEVEARMAALRAELGDKT